MISRLEAIETLKKVWQTDDFKFFGEFFRPKHENGSIIKPPKGETPYGYIRNLSSNDRKISYPKDDSYAYNRNVSFKVNVVDGLEDGKFYLIELELEDDENRAENPYALKIKDIFILEEDHLPPKEFIKEWFFRKGHTPGDASTIARQLKLNELELYTHTKRFIFELIQNADDMPFGRHSVNIEIYLLRNHLLFLHNGKFFDREDVKAISDAAKSTKDKSIRQIGYKGIGFKSVFTDSFRVYIKSADYSFKFDKLHPIYQNFWDLYSGYSNKLTIPARKKFELEFKDQVDNYTNIDKIPWQIKPIWVDKNEYPEELLNSPFFSRNHQVSIALEIGGNIIQQKNYNSMIKSLLLEPRFMLFLRNTKGFIYQQLKDDGISEPLHISLRNNYGKFDVLEGEKTLSTYIKNEFEIKITNDDFIKSGLNFQKRDVEGGKVEFYDIDGRRIENIPEKLGMLEDTIISLAAKVDGNNIMKLKEEESALFNYLPTSDQRFGFPFLVNADFVTKTDREFIQIENSWNHYLFFHIGHLCIEWIAALGNTTHDSFGKKLFTYAKTYLRLLPESYLDENHEELGVINKSFNRGIIEAVSTISFIIDSNGQLRKCSEIVLDNTKISVTLGAQLFKKLSGTSKELPHLILEELCLKFEYLEIEKYSSDQLIEHLDLEDNKELLSSELRKLSEARYLEFLVWLDDFCKTTNPSKEWIIRLPFMRTKQEVYCIEELLANNLVYIKTQKTKTIEHILEKIGYFLTVAYLDEFPSIFERINHIDTYVTKDLKLYERISANKVLFKLDASEKFSLIKFFETLEGVGDTKYAKTLKLFKSKEDNDNLRPLIQLISNQCTSLPKWLQHLIIDESEENQLSGEFLKFLIKKETIFTKIFCNPDLYEEVIPKVAPEDIQDFYQFILKVHSDKLETDIPKYTGIRWLYTSKTNSFQLPDAVYCHDSLLEIETEKYLSTKDVLEGCCDILMPHPASLPLIKLFSLGGKKTALKTLFTKECVFDGQTINNLFFWLENKSEKEFLRYCSVVKSEENQYMMVPSNNLLQYYSANAELNQSISQNSSISSNLKLLPSELFNTKLKEIGLLEGNELLEYLVNNGMASKTFIQFIPQDTPRELKEHYINKLEIVDLSSGVIYDKNTFEHKIVELVMNLGKFNDDESIYDKTIAKITINGQAISAKNISDNISFKILRKESEETYELKLSDILDDHNDQTALVTSVAESFIDLNRGELKNKLFKLKREKHSKILEKLNSLQCEYFSPIQILFLLLYKEENGIKEQIGKKPSFPKYLFEKDKLLYATKAEEFINICYEKSYPYFSNSSILIDFNPYNLILSNEFSLPSERVPTWLEKWMNDEDLENKQKFLSKTGLNAEDSWVHKLRESIILKDYDEFFKCVVNLDNPVLLKNTLSWLKDCQDTATIEFEAKYLKPLYDKIASVKVPFSDILVPVITNSKSEITLYSVIEQDPKNEYHLINSGWGKYAADVMNFLFKNGNYIIDEVLPVAYRKELKPLVLTFTSVLSKPKLNANSYPFDDPYYTDWEQKATYVFMIYKGISLPREIRYNNNLLKEEEFGKVDKVENIYYVTEDEKQEILFSLKGVLPEPIRIQLRDRKDEYSRKKRHEKETIVYSEEENLALKRLFGNEIPKGFHKDLNLASLIKGLNYLNTLGFDVTDAEENLKLTHNQAQLFPVYATGSDKEKRVPLTIKCRSAKLGLLYLRASTWRELQDSNTYLYILTGKESKDCHFCRTRD